MIYGTAWIQISYKLIFESHLKNADFYVSIPLSWYNVLNYTMSWIFWSIEEIEIFPDQKKTKEIYTVMERILKCQN